jgi:hypothetical protein
VASDFDGHFGLSNRAGVLAAAVLLESAQCMQMKQASSPVNRSQLPMIVQR